MENNKASMTAIVSAFARAYHSLNDEPKIFNDFLAQHLLLKEEFDNISKNMAAGIKYFNPENAHLFSEERSALNWVVQTQLAPTPLARSRYAEEMLENAINLGVKQYVILGAGFDTFSYRRIDLLDKINVFEVDHPVTQQLKLDRIRNLGWERNDSTHYVAVDFSKKDFKESLLQAGFNPNLLTFFSVLGLTYYLTKEEIEKLFKDIVSITPAGSSIVFDYPDEDIFNPDKTVKRVQSMVYMAKMAGESMKSGYNYVELEKELEKVGLLIYEHLTPSEIEKRYFRNRTDYFHAFENVNYTLGVVNKKS